MNSPLSGKVDCEHLLETDSVTKEIYCVNCDARWFKNFNLRWIRAGSWADDRPNKCYDCDRYGPTKHNRQGQHVITKITIGGMKK